MKENISFWAENLKEHKDRRFVDKLLHDIENGVEIGFVGELSEVERKNWPSTETYRKEIDDFIQKHSQTGSIEGPFEIDDSMVTRTSPLGAFQKKGSTKIRVIHDLSWPPGESINDGIDKSDYSVMYASVNDAVKLCEKFEKPWLAKYDLADAYLSIPVCNSDKEKIGFIWDVNGVTKKFRYGSLPFGLRSSSYLFTQFAEALMYMSKNRGASQESLFYLDDSLTIAGSKDECKRSLEIMIETAERCGLKVQHSKTAGPERNLEFLGICINTIDKKLEISKEKIVVLLLSIFN